jgi:TRAP-type mannitol/chloroaromatic compound transport system substrate-binding protein
VKRREFFKNAKRVATIGVAGALVSSCDSKDKLSSEPTGAPAVVTQKIIRWKMVTTWPPKVPVFQTGAEDFAERVKLMSRGRLIIKVYAGGELAPPLGVFDAVRSGTVEMGNSAAYYWSGKTPQAQFFTAVPYGFTAQQMNAWLYHGGGLKLWQEVYKPFDLVPFPMANTGVQMGGWFNKKIETPQDLDGLKMRIPGLGGKVMAKAGVNVVLLPAAELYTALERGVIDALEWVGPYHDLKLGFYRAAKYYYYPGWHEPGTVIELVVNRSAWEKLPADLKAIVRAAAAEANVKALAEFDAKNGEALVELINRYKVNVVRYPDDVLKTLHKLGKETLHEVASENKEAKKVHDAFKNFAKKVEPWTAMSERAYMEAKAL